MVPAPWYLIIDFKMPFDYSTDGKQNDFSS